MFRVSCFGLILLSGAIFKMEENITLKTCSSRMPPINPLNSNVRPPPVCPPAPLKFFSKRRNENACKLLTKNLVVLDASNPYISLKSDTRRRVFCVTLYYCGWGLQGAVPAINRLARSARALASFASYTDQLLSNTEIVSRGPERHSDFGKAKPSERNKNENK